VIAPEIQSLCGDIKAQNGEIKALSVQIAGLQHQLHFFEKCVNPWTFASGWRPWKLVSFDDIIREQQNKSHN